MHTQRNGTKHYKGGKKRDTNRGTGELHYQMGEEKQAITGWAKGEHGWFSSKGDSMGKKKRQKNSGEEEIHRWGGRKWRVHSERLSR